MKVTVDSVSNLRVSQIKAFFLICGAALISWINMLYGVFLIMNAFFKGASST
jgi:hypothetical protein